MGREADALLRPGGHDDLVRVLGEACLAPARGQLLAERVETLGRQVGERLPAHLGEHVGGDAGQLVGGVEPRRGPADRQRDEAGLPGARHHLGEDLLGVAGLPLGQRVDLPVIPVLLAARRRQRADERAASDARGHIAQLGQLAVDASCGEVVHADQLGELARGRKLLPGLQLAGVDRCREAVDHLLGQRQRAASGELRQVNLV